jgi:asparagine synthase (glutamine-hydrolysing)
VAISGTGGDELFAGYPWFQNMEVDCQKPSGWYLHIAAQFARQPGFDTMLAGSYGEKLYHLRTLAGFLSRYSTQHYIFGSLGTARLLTPSMRVSTRAGRAEYFDLQEIDELSSAGVLDRVSALCLRGYTANQLLRDIDVASMAHSLEIRVPYLDPVVADITLSLPFKSRSGGGDTSNSSLVNTYRYTGAKKILIDAGRPLLPPDFDMQPKRGFTMPFGTWLNGPLSDVIADTLSDIAIRKRGWFNPMEVRKVQDDFKSGIIGWAHPWLLMITELWAREFLDKSNG